MSAKLWATEAILCAAKSIPFVGRAVDIVHGFFTRKEMLAERRRLNEVVARMTQFERSVRDLAQQRVQAALREFSKPQINGPAFSEQIRELRAIQKSGFALAFFEGLLPNNTHLAELKRSPNNYGRLLHGESPDQDKIHLFLDLDRTQILEMSHFAFTSLLSAQRQGAETNIVAANDIWALPNRSILSAQSRQVTTPVVIQPKRPPPPTATDESILQLQGAAATGDSEAMVDLGRLYYAGKTPGVRWDYGAAVDLFRKAAAISNTDAMLYLGDAYFHGKGVALDHAEAVRWWRTAAEAGRVPAMYLIGEASWLGRYVKQDDAEAVRWIQKAAEAGCVPAMCLFGEAFWHGRGLRQDYAEAAQWLLKAAVAIVSGGISQFDRTHMYDVEDRTWYHLGEAYWHGRGLKKDHAEAVLWYQKAADGYNSDAMFSLARAYWHGKGVGQDHAEAFRWVRKAAEFGCAPAMYSLGEAYWFGNGVNQSYAEAVLWYQKAVAKENVGSPDHYFRIGEAFWNGTGVNQDYAEAVLWYERAAEGYNTDAMLALGEAYWNGEGVEQNHTEAVRWFSEAGCARAMDRLGEAAAAGNAEAMLYLGLSCLDEEEVDEAVQWIEMAAAAGNVSGFYHLGCHFDHNDPAEAVLWYQRGADAGDSEAMFALGMAYRDGAGVSQDFAKAVRWLRKADATES